MHSPVYTWFGSYDKAHSSQSNADDISSGASLLLKTYVTWVNQSEDAAAEMIVAGNGGNELVADGRFGAGGG